MNVHSFETVYEDRYLTHFQEKKDELTSVMWPHQEYPIWLLENTSVKKNNWGLYSGGNYLAFSIIHAKNQARTALSWNLMY